jgi:hypothetical protein
MVIKITFTVICICIVVLIHKITDWVISLLRKIMTINYTRSYLLSGIIALVALVLLSMIVNFIFRGLVQ